jgi:hypothetical protein
MRGHHVSNCIRLRDEDCRRRFRTTADHRKWHRRARCVTFRPFRTALVCLNVLPAGGRALQRAGTKLKVHWSTPSPSVQPSGALGLKHLIMQLRRLIALLALSLLLSQQLRTQTPTQAPSSGSPAAQTSGAAHNESAKTKCTDNGPSMNGKGKPVPQPAEKRVARSLLRGCVGSITLFG